MSGPTAEKDAGPYCLGYGPCLHALTAPCQSVGLPCERRTRAPAHHVSTLVADGASDA